MKYLKDYTNKAISKALKEYGGFFAFNNKQFQEAKKDGVKYVELGSGFLAPVKNAEKLLEAIKKVHIDGIKQDLKENGKINIIKRELANYEAYYTGELLDTKEALADYGITIDEISKVYNEERMNQFSCDICDKDGSRYFGTNENYGFCDNPECIEKAKRLNKKQKNEALNHCLENDDFQGALEVIGDGDIFDII